MKTKMLTIIWGVFLMSCISTAETPLFEEKFNTKTLPDKIWTTGKVGIKDNKLLLEADPREGDKFPNMADPLVSRSFEVF